MSYTNSVYIMIVTKAADALSDSGQVIAWQRPEPIPFVTKLGMLRHAVELLWPEIEKLDIASQDKSTLSGLSWNHLYADFLDYWEIIGKKHKDSFPIRIQYDEEPRLIL